MALFVYPATIHRRRLKPPRFATYQEFKPFVREEFGARCIYCLVPDTLRREDNFGVEHYRPKGQFPSEATRYANLFYACNTCNRRKGKFWPTRSQLARGEFYPNPCAHVMDRHLRYRGASTQGESPTGHFVIKRLQLNEPRSVQEREILLNIVAAYRAESQALDREIIAAGAKLIALRKAKAQPQRQQRAADIQENFRTK